MIEVKIIADSISPSKARITTMQLKYPRFIHSEFMTHRLFSRNASSSRAIPVKKMLKQVWNDPAVPIHWGANKAGMQANEELKGFKLKTAKVMWKSASKLACIMAWSMMHLGLHKQVANRILEPFQYIHVIVTATEWDNFFALRAHNAAQPEIQELAFAMQKAMKESKPKVLKAYKWHLPYLSDTEVQDFAWLGYMDTALKVSAARCARVSYLNHEGKTPTTTDDLNLYSRLIDSSPMHASPIEHQARPLADKDTWSGNFKGWEQYRKVVENAAT
jgi:thymidylate synthase ThyX